MRKTLLLTLALAIGLNSSSIHSANWSEIINNAGKVVAIALGITLIYKVATFRNDETTQKFFAMQEDHLTRADQFIKKRAEIVEKEQELLDQQRTFFEKTEMVLHIKTNS